MLRIFKQYYPIRNIFFFIGEGLVIYASVLMASSLLLKGLSFPFSLWLYLKILLITFICQTSLYYNDLYSMTKFVPWLVFAVLAGKMHFPAKRLLSLVRYVKLFSQGIKFNKGCHIVITRIVIICKYYFDFAKNLMHGFYAFLLLLYVFLRVPDRSLQTKSLVTGMT